MYLDNNVPLSELVGKKIKAITGLEEGSDEVRIFTDDGREYMFYHSQDCCESVRLNDLELSSKSLVGGTVISSEAVEGEDEKPDEWSESWTWTFYKIETDKGGLWMRWLGESNGYYSESVDFVWVNKPTKMLDLA